MKLSHYPTLLSIDGKTFTRSKGSLHDTKSEVEREKLDLMGTHYVRTFWTGGEKLSDGSIRKSYFLLVCKK